MAPTRPKLIPLSHYRRYPAEEMQARAAAFAQDLRRRRSVRQFSSRPVPREVIEQCLWAAGSAPSGANQQPWQFVVVADPEVKRRIREAAEDEERAFYSKRATPEWLEALAPLGTDPNKPFLESAPYIIAVFARSYGMRPDGTKVKHYYVTESVGIAAGMLIAAVHEAGLASLTHTPSPMCFLNEILGRPPNERPFLLLVVGHPEEDTRVPDLPKKPLEDYVTFV